MTTLEFDDVSRVVSAGSSDAGMALKLNSLGLIDYSAIPPLVGFVATKAGSQITEVTSPSTLAIVPAPPAGFFHLLFGLFVYSRGSTPWTPTYIELGQSVSWLPTAAIAQATRTSPVNGLIPLALTNELRLTVTGGGLAPGTPINVFASYIRLPLTSSMVVKNVVLTASYQSLALTIPAGFAARVLGTGGEQLNAGASVYSVMNGDISSTTLCWQITRGGSVYYIEGTAVTTGARAQSSGIPPTPFLSGDIVEVKTKAAITNAGSILAQFVFEIVPVLT